MFEDPFQRAFGHDARSGGNALVARRAHPDVGHVLTRHVEGVVVCESPTIVQRFDLNTVAAAVRQYFTLQRVHRAGFASECRRLQ